jgi:hypothetical protein
MSSISPCCTFSNSRHSNNRSTKIDQTFQIDEFDDMDEVHFRKVGGDNKMTDLAWNNNNTLVSEYSLNTCSDGIFLIFLADKCGIQLIIQEITMFSV